MKKVNLFIVLLVYTMRVIADPVDIETAKKVAKNYMNNKLPDRTNTIKNLFNETYKETIVYYIVNFEEGGWVMISAEDNTVPILGFSFEGTAVKNTAKPPAYDAWVNNYKEQIFNARSSKTRSLEVKDKWDKLINPPKLKSLQYDYTPGTPLLDVPGRGEVQWGQSRNNDGGCSPSYNEFCPDKDCDDACHNKTSAGCGAVALGQIMWYWQWPDNSSYRSYDWSLMPNELLDSSSNNEGDEIAHLLRDIGRASNMHYWCAGAWATTNKLVDALKKFKYKKAEKKVRSHFDYDDAWEDLLRAEIDAGRPVLYRGGNVVDLDDLPDELGEVHYFVLDGYSATDPNHFHFNWGWNGDNNGYFYLNDLTPDDDGTDEYNKHQRAIVGISPTCSEAPYNIDDVDYSTVSDFKHEQARHNITLPANGESLTVEEGGKLILTAGNSIRLTPGMSAEPGSYFRAEIRELSFSQSGIDVPFWPDGLTPDGDGIGDELCYIVYNANTWEFHAYNIWDQVIYQSAGTITGNMCCVWDGTNACDMCDYRCIIRFRNSCGEMLYHEHMVGVNFGSKSTEMNNTKSLNIETNINDEISDNNETNIDVYPNPTNGIFIIKLYNTQMPVYVKLTTTSGSIVYNQQHKTKTIEIDLSGQSKGIYLIKVITGDKNFIRKVIYQ